MSTSRCAAVAGLAAIVLAFSSCFDPVYKPPLRCAADGSCPSGLMCMGGWCDNGGSASDANPPSSIDAAPVACERDDDCQTPPPCQLPGSCDLEVGRCVFGTVDCSSLNDPCNRGVCSAATGECEARPINEGQDCNGGTTCGPYGECTSDAPCDPRGTQVRQCTSNTCRSGTCTSAVYQEPPAKCTRDTEDDDCQTDTVTDCGPCGSFSDTCDEIGTQTCTYTDFKCRSNVCTALPESRPQTCDRDTDGDTCGTETITNCTACDYASTCAESAPDQSCTCNRPRCASGTCTIFPESCDQPCTRDTEGAVCGCSGGCPEGEGFRVSLCQNESCVRMNQCDFCQ